MKKDLQNPIKLENGQMKPTLYGERVESISTLEKIADLPAEALANVGALGISSSELLK